MLFLFLLCALSMSRLLFNNLSTLKSDEVSIKLRINLRFASTECDKAVWVGCVGARSGYGRCCPGNRLSLSIAINLGSLNEQ